MRNGRKSCREATKEKDESEQAREREREADAPLLKSAVANDATNGGWANSTVTDKILRKCAKHISRFPNFLIVGSDEGCH